MKEHGRLSSVSLSLSLEQLPSPPERRRAGGAGILSRLPEKEESQVRAGAATEVPPGSRWGTVGRVQGSAFPEAEPEPPAGAASSSEFSRAASEEGLLTC